MYNKENLARLKRVDSLAPEVIKAFGAFDLAAVADGAMKTIIHFILPLVLTLLALTSFVHSTLAQEVSIPDPGLNAAIRAALQKPVGPLTEQDLLSLTNLNARNQSVKSIVGLEAARNLVSLDLEINRLTNF